MIPVLLFPQFDPVLLQIGPLAIRWYALAYITALRARLAAGAPAGRCLARQVATPLQQVDDFLTWATLGVVLGGRLGYVLFYQPAHFLARSAADLRGLGRRHVVPRRHARGSHRHRRSTAGAERIPILGLADRIAVAAPIGLFLGRVANFINGELWGRPAPDWLPWAMIFPEGRTRAAPSQPALPGRDGGRGVVRGHAGAGPLAARCEARPGFLTGAFLAGYAVARIIGEVFRQPDAFLGFLFAGATMGQLLSLPMLAVGLALMLRARPRAVLA